MKPSAFGAHDHAACIASAVAVADELCAASGLQLTPVRRRVLEVLLERHRAMGAYDILDVLRAEGHAAQPPVAYRALDFLVQHGLAHRIEGLNAFVACAHPGADHAAAFLICRNCDTIAEMEAPEAALAAEAARSGFRLEGAVIEAHGLCPRCQDAA